MPIRGMTKKLYPSNKRNKMSSNTIIIGLFLLILCILPVAVIDRNRKKKKKIFQQSLTDLAKKTNCNISEYEILNETAIGIDKENHRLFFIRCTTGHEVQQTINLTEIKKCRMAETGRTVESVRVTEKLELAFTPFAPGQQETSLNVYDVDIDNLTLSGEFQFTEKWVQLVNDHLAIINKKN
jgi:dipeptide/tripeptide permease